MSISAEQVKTLRDKTGAGMMDCKKALSETSGDLEAAVEYLRVKGLAAAGKKAGRATREGLVHAYVHPGNRVGVLLEVNCETDFVARTEEFRELVNDLALHIAASAPLVVGREELPAETVEREREIYRAQALEEGKPEKVVDKIVEGKLKKYYGEVCLLEQAYVKDTDRTIEDVVKEAIARLKENITVSRFTRFQLGDGG
jgi:elongation factor Ts